MEQIKIEQIKVGDKVIRADGLAGKVVELAKDAYENDIVICAYENGETAHLDEYPLDFYYLIGTTILGNKIEVSEIEQRIEQNKQRIAEIKKENDQLRKQAWRLRNTMNGQYPLPVDKKDGEEMLMAATVYAVEKVAGLARGLKELADKSVAEEKDGDE